MSSIRRSLSSRGMRYTRLKYDIDTGYYQSFISGGGASQAIKYGWDRARWGPSQSNQLGFLFRISDTKIEMGKFPTSLILYYLFQASLLLATLHLLPQLKLYQTQKSLIFWSLTLLTFLLSFLVYIKNPGHLLQDSAKQIYTPPHPTASPQQPSNPLETGKNIIDNISNTNFQKRFCRLCNVSQPFRAKHCHDCERCVSTFDHHCFLLSNCIGEKNRPYFYTFLFCGSIQLGYKLYLVSSKIQFSHPDMILMCTLGGLCLSMAMFIIMIVFHTYLMLKGITTWQYFSWKYISYLTGFRKYKSPFSKGVCNNISTYWSAGCRHNNTEWVHEYYPENI